ncbi:MBL fold metallo-hydrolase [Burkholderia cepacia]|uniref:MBL fold metallo-hydrolase n=1 Tax=Burkholderia cepacia TaxID=292 RepID=UPI00158DBE03|nr:MBL fold metallo-hydrolase [Burkholderia cepacia]
MKITMLGTGAALPDPDRAQSAILLTLNNGRHFLFDCGEGATRQMVRANIDPASVGFVFLTHLHHDHICDYPYFVISSWMLNKTGAPLVLGPKGTRHFVDHLFEHGAYQTDFRARSAYPIRQQNLEAIRPEVREVSPGVVFQDDDVKISVDWVEHIPREVCECFGVRVEAEGKVIAFSGDTAPCDAMVKLARDADLLIHECTFPESFIAHRAKTGVGTFSHTSPTDLGKIAVRANVKSLVATHFGHFDSTSPVLKRATAKHLPVEQMGPHLMDEIVTDIRKNYTGPLRLAHDLMRIDL